ncbi:MAG: hypothetical protein AB7F76_03475 [Parvibaculaceae bacterium]|jgi:hypothetical protein
MLKFMTLAVAGIVTIAIIRKVMDVINASRAQVKVRPQNENREVRSLRQDPKTGIYFPED